MCVRLAQMGGLDLRLFQFDYDQTFAVLFVNVDGTVYGRYGTRAGKGPDSTTHVSLPSLRKAMERALALHGGYPANRAELAGKQGPAPEYRTARAIPGLENREERVSTNRGCTHCHEVRENVLRFKWSQRKLTRPDLFVYPLPENTGMKIEVDDGLRVATVTPDSPAARAGILAGDELRAMEGQPLLSQADVQWALHHAPAEGRVSVTLARAGQSLTKTLALSGNWKETDISWRPSSGPGLRWGLWSDPVSAEDRGKQGLPAGMALKVRSLFAPRATPLQKAGLRIGDVIVAADGRTDFANEGQFLAYLRIAHGPGDQAKLMARRGAERIELSVPMW